MSREPRTHGHNPNVLTCDTLILQTRFHPTQLSPSPWPPGLHGLNHATCYLTARAVKSHEELTRALPPG